MTQAQPTISEIARRAGVSQGTASTILSGRSRPARRRDAIARAERVRAVAAELGYRANGAARSLAAGRFGAATLLTSAHSSHLEPAQLMAVSRALEQAGLRTTFASLPDEELASDPEALPRALRERHSDGIIATWHWAVPELAVEAVARSASPVIWLNARLPGDCVHPDDRGAGEALVARIAGHGHRRIGWLRPASGGHFSGAERQAGIEAAIARRGLEPAVGVTPELDAIADPSARSDALCAAWCALIARERPDCVVALGDMDLWSALRAARELELAVPRELSLVGFAGPGVDAAYAGIARMNVPHTAMGRAAVRELLAKIDAPAAVRPPVVLPHSWTPGHTLVAATERKP